MTSGFIPERLVNFDFLDVDIVLLHEPRFVVGSQFSNLAFRSLPGPPKVKPFTVTVVRVRNLSNRRIPLVRGSSSLFGGKYSDIVNSYGCSGSSSSVRAQTAAT